MSNKMSPYIGISYPSILTGKITRGVWKRFMCKRHYHLFDEVVSDRHYLYCDACGFELEIKDKEMRR
jgi:hypothetical protein